MYRKHRFSSLLISSVLSLLLLYANALYALDTNTESISLKTNCGSDPDCFTDTTAMMSWIWGTRDPSVAKPLLVNISTGTFIMVGSTCSTADPYDNINRGNVTFRGSGRDNTILSGGNSGFGVISVTSCKNLSFEDLTIQSDTRRGAVGSQIGVVWTGRGNSTWTNVEIDASYAAWYDSSGTGAGCGATPGGRHNWHSSILSTTASTGGGAYGFYTACGDNWFYGGEIIAINTSSATVTSISASSQSGSIHLYGSDVRAVSTSSAISGTPTGLSASNGGVIHFHGGEVVARHENAAANSDAVGINATGTGSMVHTIETSFGLLPAGSGIARRITVTAPAKVDSVFQWPAGTLAPAPGDATGVKHLVSTAGSDTFIETDCPISTGCQTAGSYPHLMIYAPVCTGTGATKGPWYDTITNKCRGL